MNTLKNSIRLIGRLGMSPIVKSTATGSKLAIMRLATQQFTKSKEGEWVEQVDWHNLIVWGALVRSVELSCTKGTQVLIEGALTYRDFVDKDGNKRINTEIRVRELQVVAKPKEQGHADQIKNVKD